MTVEALHKPRRLWLALLFLALAMRALLPAGFMPAAASGHVTLILCGASGGSPIDVDFGGKAQPANAADSCAFAALGLPLLGADVPLFAHPLRLPGAFALILPFTTAACVAAHFRLPPALGPPARS